MLILYTPFCFCRTILAKWSLTAPPQRESKSMRQLPTDTIIKKLRLAFQAARGSQVRCHVNQVITLIEVANIRSEFLVFSEPFAGSWSTHRMGWSFPKVLCCHYSNAFLHFSFQRSEYEQVMWVCHPRKSLNRRKYYVHLIINKVSFLSMFWLGIVA